MQKESDCMVYSPDGKSYSTTLVPRAQGTSQKWGRKTIKANRSGNLL